MPDSPWTQPDPTDVPEGLVAIRMVKYLDDSSLYPAIHMKEGNPNLFYGKLVPDPDGRYKYWLIPMICKKYHNPSAGYQLDMFERI